MDTVLLLITAGLCAVSSHAERHYHVVYDSKNWTEAQSYCREKYTDLATIDNMEDVNTLINMANARKINNTYQRVWIGLYRGTDLDSWRWSLSDTSFYKHGETEFRRWGSGQPNNLNSRQYCTVMLGDGLWNDVRCNSRYKAVCSYVRGSNVTFIFSNVSMTWAEALSYCRANYTDLTSVRNITENQRVQELVPAGDSVWIGLFRDFWKWSDGSNSSFRHWIPGQPDNYGERTQSCMAADFVFSGQWRDWFCDAKTSFICYNASVGEQTTQQAMTNQATTNQATTKQATTKQATTKQATTKQATTNQATTNQATTNQAMTKQATTKQATTKQARTKQATTKQATTKQAMANQPTTNQATTKQATTNQAMTKQATTKRVTKQTTTKQVFRMKFKTKDSSVDLNDPAVTERILKKIKQKLRDQGLDDNIKLKWRKQPDGKVFHKEEKKTKKKKETKKTEL